MPNKKLSICIVTLNDRENLIATLKSIEFSTEIEIIIQDGVSSYDIEEVLKQFDNIFNVIKFHQEIDVGIYDAMNKAVERSSADFLMFLNCGDRIASGMQSTLLNLLSKVDPKIHCIKFLADVSGEGIKAERASKLYFFRRMLNHQSIVYRKTSFSRIKYDPRLKIAGDLKHFLEAGLLKKIGYIDLVLIEYMNGGAAANDKGIRQNWIDRSTCWKWRIDLIQKMILMFAVVLRFFMYALRIKK